MVGSATRYPEAVFLKRPDMTGYGFFFSSESDFKAAVESFTAPILRSFAGEPVPGQPDPQDHLKTAAATLLGQAFDRSAPPELGPEGISRAVAAVVRQHFATAVPRVLLIERRDNRLAVRPAIEFLRHPGHPLAVVVDGLPHGGEAHFFDNADQFEQAGQSNPDQHRWLPQIVYRLYRRTPSVMVGKPSVDQSSGRHSVEFRAMEFGLKTPLEER